MGTRARDSTRCWLTTEAADDEAGGVVETCIDFIVWTSSGFVPLVLDDVYTTPTGAGLERWRRYGEGCHE